MILLSVVEDVFQITGRGIILIPGLSETSPPHIKLRRNDPIELRLPGGEIIKTKITELEFLDGPNKRSCVPILLSPPFTKDQIPIGTEVWVEDKTEAEPGGSVSLAPIGG